MSKRTVIHALLVLAASRLPARDSGAFPPRSPRGDAPAPSPRCSSCGNETYGTSIEWSGTPAEAAKKAKQEEKLVFVLHVSGHFEDPRFT